MPILLEDSVGYLTVEDSSGWLLLEGNTLATLATQIIKRAGVTPSYAAATSGGDTFNPDHQTFLHVKNGGGSAVTVTVAATGLVDGDIPMANVVDSVPASGEKMLGPFPAQLFAAKDGTGLASIAYSAVTSVTVAVLHLSQP